MKNLVQLILQLPRHYKQGVVALVDLLSGISAFVGAQYLLGVPLPFGALSPGLVSVMAAALGVGVFVVNGLYRAVFRYTSMAAIISIARAVCLYAAVLVCISWMLSGPSLLRMSLLQPLLLLILVVSTRTVVRYWLGADRVGRMAAESRPRLLIYGAGSAGASAAAAMESNREFVVLGFLDDDPAMVGRVLNGHPIHSPSQLPDLIPRYALTDILLAMPSATRARRNEVLARLREFPLHVRTVASMDRSVGPRTSDVQELGVEDLLGRDPVPPNHLLLSRYSTDRTVLVTGAGGSIGGELCRQLLRLKPRRLLLLDHSEYALYAIHDALAAEALLQGDIELVSLLGSVCDARRMNEVMAVWKPDIVYHAAAYKHVPIVEHNPAEGVRNNVLGTLIVAALAMRHSVGRFVLVSTDKAVRPTNIMGASKRLAELVLQAFAAETQPVVGLSALSQPGTANRTCFCMVRFGNVLGSSGSVVPLFREQIRKGGPVTVTHPEVTRYFMTIPEAAQLVIQAGAMAHGGDVFVLDMGKPVRIVDLARRMVELSGLKLRQTADDDGDIELAVTGLRPGEKLYEELLIGNRPEGTEHTHIMKAREGFLPWSLLQSHLRRLEKILASNDIVGLRELLGILVSGYQAQGKIVDLVHTASVDAADNPEALLPLAGAAQQYEKTR